MTLCHKQTSTKHALSGGHDPPSRVPLNLFYRFLSHYKHTFLPQNHQRMCKGEMLRKKLVRYNHFGTCTGAQELNHGQHAHSNRGAFVQSGMEVRGWDDMPRALRVRVVYDECLSRLENDSLVGSCRNVFGNRINII